jgi:hypothetical protein
MRPKLLDITNLLPIRMMQMPDTIMRSVLRTGEVFRRRKLKLLDITDLLPIRMMQMRNMVMQSAL